MVRTDGTIMKWLPRNQKHQRFYLYPGQGGRLLRQKRKVFLTWSVIVGTLVSAVIAALIYWLDRKGP
jgi:hypothetical protein